MPKPLSKMTVEELDAERDRLLAANQKVMAARGEAEQGFKKQSQEIQERLNQVAAMRRVAAMSAAERAELAAALSEE